MAEYRRTEISSGSLNTNTTIKKENVLNSYRSYTYNFTLAAIRRDQVNNPESYRNSELDLVILKSSGKGNSTLSTNVTPIERKNTSENSSADTNESSSQLVEGFNKKSPGRFDMFIDGVEISTLMGFSKEASTTIPTTLKFDVFEPYSINGFIEALHVAAVAGGYLTYAQASFVLKMEFIGYPDDESVEDSTAKKIELSERYFVFKFTGIEIDLSEKGTRYKCSAIPFNELGFGQSNVIKKPTNASGSTVQELLEDLMKNITSQILDANKSSKEGLNANKGDIYEIKFPTYEEQSINFDGVNDIGKSKILEPNKENTLYKFVDNGEDQQDAYNPTPGGKTKVTKASIIGSTPVVNFFNGSVLNEAIAAVIRDSTYLRDKLKNIKQNLDENDMFDYFLVSVDVEDQTEIDEESRKPFRKYTYVVTPYKIHFTKIPNYASQLFDSSKMKKRTVREYNYVYTGKNIDVLNFKLNFNLLYFEAIPYAMGNNNRPGSKDLASSPKVDSIQVKGDSQTVIKSNEIPVPKQDVVTYNTVPTDGKASQLLDDPYSVLAINLHEAVINSKVNMLTGEIQIIGDPLYLVTGSMANYRPKLNPDMPSVTVSGEAAHTLGEVLININFSNPIDINPLEDGGMMYFDKNKAPFSGIYKVLKAHSSFKDGQFTQRLEIIRIPGQTDNTKEVTNPEEKVISKPTSGEVSSETPETQDQTTNESPSNSDNSSNVSENLGTKSPLASMMEWYE